VWEEPEDLRTMLDESTFEVTEEMVRLHASILTAHPGWTSLLPALLLFTSVSDAKQRPMGRQANIQTYGSHGSF